MKKVNTGLIGGGFVAKIHAEALRRLGYVEVVALAGRNRESAQSKAAELSIPIAYGDYRELIDNPEIEVVHILTPNSLHYPMVKACIEAGKHVICEKPLAMDTKESAELLELARERNVLHCVCHNLRYYPLVKQARAMVRAGEIGDIRLVHGHYLQDWLFLETDYNWRVEADIGGKSRAVADIGTHWLDMVQHITGQKIVSVLAELTTFVPVRKKPKKEIETFAEQSLWSEVYEDIDITTEDHGTVLLRFSGGAKGVLVVCQVCPGRKNWLHFEINGSKRSLDWNAEQPNRMWIGARGEANGEFIKNPAIMAPSAARYAGTPGGLGEGYHDTFKNLFSDVYDRVRVGKGTNNVEEADFPTFVTGHQELSIVDAVLKSYESGQWVDIEY
jgi:predicted dehydrogenase